MYVAVQMYDAGEYRYHVDTIKIPITKIFIFIFLVLSNESSPN